MYFFIDPMSFSALGAKDFAAASSSYSAIEMASPVSRLRSKNADRAPGWVEIAGSAVSLYSLMSLSSSDFLYLDLTTPAFTSHLREETEAVNQFSIVRLPLQAASRSRRPPGNVSLPTP